jgi:hypothetical protein
MQKYCDACFHSDYHFRSDISASEAASVSVASTVVDWKSMGQTVADRSSNEADFLCILLYLAWRLWKSVVTLAVKRNTISGRFYLIRKVPEFERHRLPLTGSRWDIRWLIGRRTKPTFCLFPVFSVAVMEKCCDARRERNTNSGRVFAVRGCKSLGHRLPLTGSRWDIRWMIGRRSKPFFCVFFVFSVAVMEKCCDARRER